MALAVQDSAPPAIRRNPQAVAAVIEALAARFGNGLVTSLAVRQQHANTTTWIENEPPDAVVFAHTTQDVQAIVQICAAHQVPVISYGTGTSLEGHINAPHGGVSIDLSEMKRVIAVHPEDLDCVVEPGVTRKQLNEYLRDQGLFFPIDPGADASLGGMAATRAPGTNAVRYGTMMDNVRALTVVLASGEIIRTGGRAKKSAAGYDLTRLFVGSEGTLGIVTEITLKLHPVPEAISAAVCPFDSFDGAVGTAIAVIQAGIPVAGMELLDEVMIRGVNAYARLAASERPTLFFEFHGTPAAVAEQAAYAQEIAGARGALGFPWAIAPEERSRLWNARDNTLYAGTGLRPGAKAMITDVCVPISRLAECLITTKRDIEASGLIAPIVGHVGDENFHALILVDPDSPEEIARATALHERMVHLALDLDGTSTGEHGIGTGKISFLQRELGDAVDVMRAIKQALDPDKLMNPGKIFR